MPLCTANLPINTVTTDSSSYPLNVKNAKNSIFWSDDLDFTSHVNESIGSSRTVAIQLHLYKRLLTVSAVLRERERERQNLLLQKQWDIDEQIPLTLVCHPESPAVEIIIQKNYQNCT